MKFIPSTRPLAGAAIAVAASVLLGTDGAQSADNAAPSFQLAQSMNHGGMGGMAPSAQTTPGHDMMEMDQSKPDEHGGHDMSPADASKAPVTGTEVRGGQPLKLRLVAGIKEFDLTTKVIQWHILPDVTVAAYSYDGTVPGPLIRVNAGDRVRIKVKNELPEPTTIHWHGLVVPNDQDGVPNMPRPPIKAGETFTYEFAVPNTPGTYFYHTHFNADRQQALGLYGAFVIDNPKAPKIADTEYIVMLGEFRVVNGETFPAMDMEGMMPNYFTINGKSYPATETIEAKVGQKILFRFIGSGQFVHPMHIHGGPFQIVATDGNPVPAAARVTKDTVLVGPGERYDVVWTARQPGKWLVHCHINHHLTNNGTEIDGMGGLAMVIDVSG